MAKSSQPQLPAWVWLFTGVVTGLFAAFLVYLANLKAPAAPVAEKPARPIEQPKKPVETSGPAVATPESPRKFDFYTILPEAETLGTSEEEEKPATAPATKADDAAKPASGSVTPAATTASGGSSTAASESAPTKPAAGGARYFLQTGSFPRSAEADKLRAQLLLLGVPTNVQKVELKPGEVWHRVQVGPFADKAGVAEAQKKLATAHVQSIIVRPKATP